MSRQPVEAVLQAGNTEIVYCRAGDGSPVLLLRTGVLAGPLGGRLFERLAMRARVIAPVIPGGAIATTVLADWLREVTEGLGLVRPSVVIDEAMAAALLDSDVAASERFACVVVAIAGDGDADDRAARLVRSGAHVVPVAGDDAAAVAGAMLPFFGDR
jgi:hypothetical protein